MESARKMWPGRHRRWKELCALAGSGQLDGTQMHRLNGHLADCEACRAELESLSEVSAQIGPLLADNAATVDIDLPAGMRARFLSRLAAEEQAAARIVQLPRRPVLIASPAPVDNEANPKAPVTPFNLAWRTASALAACALIGFAGFSIGKRQVAHVPPRFAAASVPARRLRRRFCGRGCFAPLSPTPKTLAPSNDCSGRNWPWLSIQQVKERVSVTEYRQKLLSPNNLPPLRTS